MGGEPYHYFVPFETDLQKVLDRLREREFAAGRYYTPNSDMDWAAQQFLNQEPPAKPRSMDEAIKAAGESGTRSILDITSIAQAPDYGVASPLEDGVLISLYGTDKPSPQMVRENMNFWKKIGRGMCRYIILYKDAKPVEICFAGYSYD